jgi:beta-phosphoglucomutase-like phosphatase (HAD superfamily)
MTDLSTRAFIFDMDGTLVDNMPVHTEAWGTLLRENGVELDAHKFLVATAGKTNREILPTVFGEISEERITELAKRKETLYRDAYLPIRKPIDGVVEFLTDMRRFFGAITTATDVTVGKPDPAMFLVSAEKLGVEPKNCIVFEDAIGGFEAAHRAGMVSIGITTVNSAEDILNCDSVVEAHADFTQMRPQELAEKYVP